MNKKLLEITDFLLNQMIQENRVNHIYHYLKLDDDTLYNIDSYTYSTLWNLRYLLQQYESGNIPIDSSCKEN